MVGGAPNILPDEVGSSPFVVVCVRKAKADWLLVEPDLSNDPVLLPIDDDLTKGSNISSCSPRSINPSSLSSVFKGWPDVDGA